MTELVPVRPFADAEALDWLRSQSDGRITASAAALGRQWGWNRVRASRRLKAWHAAGYIRRHDDTGAIQSDAITLRIFVIRLVGSGLRASWFCRTWPNRLPNRRFCG